MKWRCGVCGYIHDGAAAPRSCPKCGATQEKFEKIEGDAAARIDRSRLTNSLHMQLFRALEEIRELADKGIEDALDPACVKIFTHARDQALFLRQAVKAELQGHMNKGKWG